MSEEKNLAQAKAVFETLCSALDKEEWKYKKDEEKLKIECGARGDDLPMELIVLVDAKRMIVSVLSLLPFKIKEDKRLDAAVAICGINNRLADGCFDYDVTSGSVFFRMTTGFLDSLISQEVMKYLLYCSCHTIDEYNDKLLMISKGIMSLEQFFSSLEE